MLPNSIKIVLLAIIVFPLQQSHAQIQINELLAVNSTIAYDPDFGEFSDFLELRNAAAVPINLRLFYHHRRPRRNGQMDLARFNPCARRTLARLDRRIR